MQVEDFIDACFDAEDRLDRGLAALSVKTVRNLYVHLNGIFEFAVSKGWAHTNPCRTVEKPASPQDDDMDIHFLDQAELDALLAAATTPVCRHTPATLCPGEASQEAARHRALGMAAGRRAPRMHRRDRDLLVPRNA